VPDDQTLPLLSAIRSVAVGSTNPVKVSAARAVIAPLAPRARIDAVAVASTVSDQPFGDDETIRGARARATAARDALGAELGIGIEGGVVEQAEAFQVRNQSGGAASHAVGQRAVIALHVFVAVPVAAREAVVVAAPDLHEANAALQ